MVLVLSQCIHPQSLLIYIFSSGNEQRPTYRSGLLGSPPLVSLNQELARLKLLKLSEGQ